MVKVDCQVENAKIWEAGKFSINMVYSRFITAINAA